LTAGRLRAWLAAGPDSASNAIAGTVPGSDAPRLEADDIAGFPGAHHVPPVTNDGGLARLAELDTVMGIAVADDGSAVYFADMSQSRIRKLTRK
jgi:hypothetical protein